MAIHLVTVVGGDANPALEAMLHHYQKLGVDAFHVCLHLREENDPAREAVTEVAKRFGCGIDRTLVGPRVFVQQELYAQPRRDYPKDWFVLADCDEFHQHTMPLADLVAECTRNRWDHVRGCMLDRLAADGGFPAIDPATPLAEQFPLGSMLTLKLMFADPRKVTLVHGAISVIHGQHRTHGQAQCPPDVCFTQVHHYKWCDSVPQQLARRIEYCKANNLGEWRESAEFLAHIEKMGGRIDLSEERFLVGPCDPEYVHWERMKKEVLAIGTGPIVFVPPPKPS